MPQSTLCGEVDIEVSARLVVANPVGTCQSSNHYDSGSQTVCSCFDSNLSVVLPTGGVAPYRGTLQFGMYAAIGRLVLANEERYSSSGRSPK